MRLEEFRIRFDELRHMRKLVKAVPLADRLTELVEAYLEDAEVEAKRMRMDALRASVEVSQPPAREAPVGDQHFYVAPDVGRRALLAEAAEEIAARNEDGYDPEDVPPIELEGEPVTTKPGLPAEDPGIGVPPAGVSDSTRSQNEEPEKPCKTCGETKPLSEFPKNSAMRDGHINECKPCNAERKKRNREKKKVAKLPRRQPRERLCAAGIRCVKADPDDLVPTPAILDASEADDHPSGLCRGCQKKAGIT